MSVILNIKMGTWSRLAALCCALVSPALWGDTVHFSPAEDIQEQVQEAFILAEPGTVFHFGAGNYAFYAGLSIDVDNVTIRGDGMDKTVFSFKGQDSGAEGLFVTSDNVLLEDLAIEDAKGNGLKTTEIKNLVVRRVRAEWTGGPKETNGAYGLYPVSSQNILIEECVVIGASDAGIYVGQSENIIVRNNRVEYNVAGIEIENCHGADVYKNTATHNTGGILVFDLPGLPVQEGRDVRVFENTIQDNNTPNFAPAGNIVGTVPAGTGMMIMANANVEIFDNEIGDHGTTNILIISYLSTLKPITDPNYYPYPEAIHIHDNRFGESGGNPSGDTGKSLAKSAGTPLPDIIWDGVVNMKKYPDGTLPDGRGIAIHGNSKKEGELRFANLDVMAALRDPVNAKVLRDLKPHESSLPSLKPIEIKEGPASK